MALATVPSAPSQQAALSHLSCRRGRLGPPRHQDEEGRGGVLVKAETKPAGSSSNSDVMACCWFCLELL